MLGIPTGALLAFQAGWGVIGLWSGLAISLGLQAACMYVCTRAILRSLHCAMGKKKTTSCACAPLRPVVAAVHKLTQSRKMPTLTPTFGIWPAARYGFIRVTDWPAQAVRAKASSLSSGNVNMGEGGKEPPSDEVELGCVPLPHAWCLR